MDNSALATGETIGTCGVEAAHGTVLRVEGAFIGVANANVGRECWSNLPVVLHVETVDVGTRQPAGEFSVKGCGANSAGQEAGEGDTGVGDSVAVRLEAGGDVGEVERGEPGEVGGVQLEVENLVAHLEGVLPLDPGGVVTERKGLIHGLVRSGAGNAVHAEVRHQSIIDIRDAEFRRPAAAEGWNDRIVTTPEVADARIVDEVGAGGPGIAQGGVVLRERRPVAGGGIERYEITFK